MAADMRYEGGNYRGGTDFNKIVESVISREA